MEEPKNHKKKARIVGEGQEGVEIDGGGLEKEEASVKHPARRKTVNEKRAEPKKSSPDIAKKVQYATYAAVSTTERVINGLGSLYEKIFVGHYHENKKNFEKERGIKYFEKNDFENAISSFDSYMEEGNEEDAEVVFLLASCYVNLGKYQEAMEYFKKAHKLDSADQNIIIEMAYCFFNLEDYAEAVTYFKRAIDIAPDEGDYYYHLGSCYEKIEQIEEAKKMYKKAIDLSPRDGTYYQALGFVYENSGNHNDAIVCFKKAMDLDRKAKICGGGGSLKIKKRQEDRNGEADVRRGQEIIS